MKTLKATCSAAAFALAAMTASAISYAPTISSVTMAQDNPSSREVTISYALANGPAIVTVDIETNVTGDVWASIGLENFANLKGDANVLVDKAAGTVTWRPDRSWPGHLIETGGIRATLTAYSPENPPDYMVVDLASQTPVRVKYYASTNDLPGGLFADCYRTTSIILRHIRAKGISWPMGSFMEEKRNLGYKSDVEAVHTVTLGSDYWMGVFELTQAQWAMVAGTTITAKFAGSEKALFRPMENITLAMIREADCNSESSVQATSPEAPAANSYLGLLRARTGIDFDLPTEAQWEFACRAGHGENEYGEGTPYKYSNWDGSIPLPGRWKNNQANPGNTASGSSIGPEDGTAVCGTYAPNDWGIYDMHGNVWELCRGRWAEDITALNGAQVTAGTSAVRRGGAWVQSDSCYLRSACRIEEGAGGHNPRQPGDGFRVMCTGLLQ